ncbi:peptidase C10-like protein [Dyadobacter jejuensis]|uniref:Peptidase C10-like protein n=1 Tax=Dyadobacter jejuensis TaxID=1082580 RepID=A0A316ALZ4_9BACT|nr:C10 family peptidase [Dyadobacter jejuensis]PWJ58084.1 peptidase C10-like protein [Dyadobacter jejuensis]
MKKMWDTYLSVNASADSKTARTFGPDDCTYNGQIFIEIVTKNLNTARWRQSGAGFNDLVPVLCSSRASGKAPTGCVATAVGEVKKYHQYPAAYAWSSMDDVLGSTATATLMRDLGINHNLDNSYGCDGTGAQNKDIPRTFANMGYPTPSRGDYIFSTVHNELYNNRPVILAGGKESGWWIFNIYSNGHCWVTDAYRDTNYWECHQNPWNPSQYEKYLSTSTGQLWMNWGWGATDN